MAVPHAAGVAAIYLADHPTAAPKEVRVCQHHACAEDFPMEPLLDALFLYAFMTARGPVESRLTHAQVIAALLAAGDTNTIQAIDILAGTPLVELNTDLYGAYSSQPTVSAASGP